MTTLTTTPGGSAAPRSAPPASPAPAARRPRQGGTVLAVPALVWYLVFMVGPLLAIFVIAALHWPGMLQPVSFAGLDNARVVLDDPVFWDAVRNTAVQLAVAVPVMIVCAYMLGYYVAQRPPGHRVIRYLLFIPGLISTPAKAMVFYAALSPDGLLNGGLESVGLGSLSDAWLASPSTALACLIALDIWAGIGFTADFSERRAVGATEALLDAADRPTAIVYANDSMAVCGIGTAQRAGLAVPRDVSVVGYDNLPLGSWLHPRLTTVDQQVQRVGAAAARMLLALCGEEVEDTALAERPRLVVRESTGPAPT
ncbi:HTH-type transcriptional repressor PurR [Streptomyces tendae]